MEDVAAASGIVQVPKMSADLIVMFPWTIRIIAHAALVRPGGGRSRVLVTLRRARFCGGDLRSPTLCQFTYQFEVGL